jgi:hypothetical protein
MFRPREDDLQEARQVYIKHRYNRINFVVYKFEECNNIQSCKQRA